MTQVYTDPEHGDLQVLRVLATGRSFDVVEAQWVQRDQLVTVRAPRWVDEDDAEERQQRTEFMELEVEAATKAAELSQGALPRPMLWHVGETREPVLVYPKIEALTLDTWLARTAPGGLPQEEILPIARSLATALSALHEVGFVHGCITPDHILINEDREITLIGLGNIRRMRTAPCPAKENHDEAFSAPETRNALSDKQHSSRADAYGFGMLLSFLATGERPTDIPSGPLTRSAYAKIEEGPRGLALIIAKCILPNADKRPTPMRRLALYLTEDSLPDESTPGFGSLILIAPYGVAEGIGLRVGHLSPGPLVDRPRETPATAPGPKAATSSQEEDLSADATAATLADLDAVALPMSRRERMLGWVVSAAVLAVALWVAIRQLS